MAPVMLGHCKERKLCHSFELFAVTPFHLPLISFPFDTMLLWLIYQTIEIFPWILFPPLHSSHLLFQQSSEFSLQTKDGGKSWLYKGKSPWILCIASQSSIKFWWYLQVQTLTGRSLDRSTCLGRSSANFDFQMHLPGYFSLNSLYASATVRNRCLLWRVSFLTLEWKIIVPRLSLQLSQFLDLTMACPKSLLGFYLCYNRFLETISELPVSAFLVNLVVTTQLYLWIWSGYWLFCMLEM